MTKISSAHIGHPSMALRLVVLTALLGFFTDVAQASNAGTCDFDTKLDLCDWEVGGSSSEDWEQAKETQTSGTGPDSDVSGDGYFMYTEASNNFLETFLLESVVSESATNVTFWYHMYSYEADDMGSLYFETSTDGGDSWTTAWSESGNQGRDWLESGTISLDTNNKIRFRGVTGDNYNSDMAIDQVVVSISTDEPTLMPIPMPSSLPVPQPTVLPAYTKVWLQQFGTTGEDILRAMAVDSSNNVYVGGGTYGALNGTNAGSLDIWFGKYSSDGNTRAWIKQVGTDSDDELRAMAVDTLGKVVVGGDTSGDLGSSNSGDSDIWFAKYTSAGAEQWTVQIGDDGEDTLRAMVTDSSNNVLVGGDTASALEGTNAGGTDIWFAKYSETGTQTWIMQIGTSAYDCVRAMAMGSDTSGDVYVGGHTSGPLDDNAIVGSLDVWFAKYDSDDGSEIWIEKTGTDGDDKLRAMAVDSNGTLYVGGQTNGAITGSTNAGGYDIWFAKYEPDGTDGMNQKWVLQFGTSSDEDLRGMALDSDGTYLFVAGITQGALRDANVGGNDIWLAKYDTSTGTQVWIVQTGTASNDFLRAVALDARDDVLVAGDTAGTLGGSSAGSRDAWFAKYSALLPTAVPTVFQPTPIPSLTKLPSLVPSSAPSPEPTLSPSSAPSSKPTALPTPMPTRRCPGGTYFLASINNCENCTAGKYSPESGESLDDVCDICEKGKFSGSGASGCTSCPSGRYIDDDSETESKHAQAGSCIDCPTGELSSDDRSRCSNCKAGQYTYNNERCVECPRGTYAPIPLTDACLNCTAGFRTNNATSATQCSSCAAGTYSGLNSLSCGSCPTGKYSAPSASRCTSCPSGFYGAALASSSCTACISGRYQSAVGEASCSSCPVGKAQSATGQSLCSSCTVGKYSSTVGESSCSECISGKYQDTEGQTNCTDCASGKAQSASGQTRCDSCEHGKYMSSPGASSCTECSAGKYQGSTGQHVCTSCPKGSFTSSTGSIACEKCPVGEIAADSSSSSCKACTSPTTTSAEGAASCDACVTSYFWNPLKNCSTQQCCEECPDGVECRPSKTDVTYHFLSTLIVKKGYYRFSNSSNEVVECSLHSKYEEHCEGGPQAGDASCKEHSKGPLCALCEDDYYHPGGDAPCKKCGENSLVIDAVPTIAIAFIILITFLAWRVNLFGRAWSRIEVLLSEKYSINLDWVAMAVRIVFFDYQIITKYTEMQGVIWPSPFSQYVTFLNAIFFDFTVWVPSIECTKYDQYFGLYIWTAGPIFLYIVALAWAATMAVFTASLGMLGDGEPAAEQMGRKRALAVGGDTRQANLRLAIKEALVKANHLALSIVSLVHTLICVRIFQIFDCLEFDAGRSENDFEESVKEKILRSDFSLDCTTDEHTSVQNYAYCMCVVYVAVVPAMMTLDKRRLRSTTTSHRLLSAPYKLEYWWFDTADLYYRLSMTGFLLIVVRENAWVRKIYCIYLALGFLSFITYAKPFLNGSLNQILMTGQFAVCFAVASGYIVGTLDEDDDNHQANIIGWLLFLVNLAIVAFTVYQNRTERMFRLINALVEQRDVDPLEFSAMYQGASKIPLARALLSSANKCLEQLADNKYDNDQCWGYLKKKLLPLRGSEDQLVFNEEIPSQIDWTAFVESIIESRMKEKIYSSISQNLEVVKEGWCKKSGEINRSWKRRFLVLARIRSDMVTLMYFDNEESAQQMKSTGDVERFALGSISLEHILAVRSLKAGRVMELDDRRGRLRKFEFKSAKDNNEWVKTIGENVGDLESTSRGRSGTVDGTEFKIAAREIFGFLIDDDTIDEVFGERATMDVPQAKVMNPMRAMHPDDDVSAEQNWQFEASNPMMRTEERPVKAESSHVFQVHASALSEDPTSAFGAPSVELDDSSEHGDDDSGALNQEDDESEHLILERLLDAIDAAGVSEDEANDMIDRVTGLNGHIDAHAVEEMMNALKQNEGHPSSDDYEYAEENEAAYWEWHEDESSGNIYYHNSATGEITWSKPACLDEEGLSDEATSWEAHEDETSGDIYYHNYATGETTWTKPACLEHDFVVSAQLEIRPDSTENRGAEQGDDGDDRMLSAHSSDFPQSTMAAADTLEPEENLSSWRRVIDEKYVNELMPVLIKRLQSGDSKPTLFAVLQLLGAECHRIILGHQQKAAQSIMADEEFGERIAMFEHAEEKEKMTQQITHTKVSALAGACTADSFRSRLDDMILPAIMSTVAASVLDAFSEALLAAVSGAGPFGLGMGLSDKPSVELKVGPVKKADRIGVKVGEYRDEKGEGHWPHSQFVTDILRASFICGTAEDLVAAYEGLRASPHFKLVRVKNKIGKCKEPYNLHVNVLFHPEVCEDPILCEVQLYPRGVFDLQGRQHQAYELRRATGVQDLT